MTVTRWQSWHAAFEEAGKAAAPIPLGAEGCSRPDLRLTLTPNEYAAALGELMTTRVILMSPEQHQQACRTGSLAWYDARGRCVLILREGSRDSAGEWAHGLTPAEAQAADAAFVDVQAERALTGKKK